ncbi:hypothetical protein F5882DRAFT_459040 [Hyaloscypha sp. PMI_1271]|nr:hypothetical protein F5882DRAFT_459040 [Hyaloscypha sp. PMI_1271]
MSQKRSPFGRRVSGLFHSPGNNGKGSEHQQPGPSSDGSNDLHFRHEDYCEDRHHDKTVPCHQPHHEPPIPDPEKHLPCKEEQKPITVTVNVAPPNVNISSCCPPSTSGTGTGTTTTPIGRPVHTTGSSDGSVGAGLGGGGIIKIPGRPGNVWPGPRSKLYLPLLFIRANVGDIGARPLKFFWESPDILILPGVAPQNAPAAPPKELLTNMAGVAKGGADNTIYAHVWNMGLAPAYNALVEFYWFNPTLGFNGSDAHLIGKTYVDLAARGSNDPKTPSHRPVKCPFTWVAQYENGGHECLVVRISQPITDPLAAPAWDASQNRHIGQRNIHVMTAAESAAKPTIGISVGPLFGQPAQVAVARADTATMPWLHLVTMSRTAVPATGTPTGDVGITQPTTVGGALPTLGAVPNPRTAGLIDNSQGVTGDDKQVAFVATDGNPGAGKAHVYRVSGTQGGGTFGGYTVIVIGS